MTAIISSLFLVGVALTSGSSAQAATATAGGACTTVGVTTTIAGKSYSCVKALSGKSIWTLKSAATAAKPSVAGGDDGGPGGPGGSGGPGDEGSAADATRHAAMAKYSACLTSHGGSAMNFGGPGGFRGGPDHNNSQPRKGAQPTTPRTFPTPSAAQQKAIAACASLAPKFSGPRFPGGNH